MHASSALVYYENEPQMQVGNPVYYFLEARGAKFGILMRLKGGVHSIVGWAQY